MTSADFIALKDHFLSENEYFSQGLANAFKDATNNQVYARVKGELQPVFPMDSYGNYFYLRSEGDIKYDPKFQERVSDCGPQRLSFQDTLIIQLVAIVKGADEYKLLQNLRNTAMSYTGFNAIPVGASYNRESIVASEMKGLPKEDTNKALANLTDQTIVRVTLQVSKMFVPGNCTVDPCKDC